MSDGLRQTSGGNDYGIALFWRVGDAALRKNYHDGDKLFFVGAITVSPNSQAEKKGEGGWVENCK